jgi:hypothetical protein
MIFPKDKEFITLFSPITAFKKSIFKKQSYTHGEFNPRQMVWCCATNFSPAITGRRAVISWLLEIWPAFTEGINCAHNDI